ncbi:MAG: hypothetical protein ACOC59_03640, partial [Bacteroidota bacterium]
VDTITTGAETLILSSIAVKMKVCSPLLKLLSFQSCYHPHQILIININNNFPENVKIGRSSRKVNGVLFGILKIIYYV